MKIEHLFKTKSHNLLELFEETKTMSQFKKKLEKQQNNEQIISDDEMITN